MEAPLHHSPVPVPSLGSGVIMAPPSSWSAPPPQHQHQQQDAIGATVRHHQQQQQAAAVSAAIMAHQNQKPPLPPVAVTMAMAGGREQCPRCASRDTKFCYYNNYNTAQPRHFCRACRRYWTLGGSLRNVPVGGSTRKRPRPARPTRAMAVSAATMRSTASSCGGAAFPAPAPAQQTRGGGLLSSLLLLGSKVPLLEGRLGGSDLVSLGGQQPAFAGDFLAQLGFVGAGGPLLWPPATTTTVLDEADSAETMTTWKSGGEVPPASALWQELAAAMPAAASPAPQLLL